MAFSLDKLFKASVLTVSSVVSLMSGALGIIENMPKEKTDIAASIQNLDKQLDAYEEARDKLKDIVDATQKMKNGLSDDVENGIAKSHNRVINPCDSLETILQKFDVAIETEPSANPDEKERMERLPVKEVDGLQEQKDRYNARIVVPYQRNEASDPNVPIISSGIHGIAPGTHSLQYDNAQHYSPINTPDGWPVHDGFVPDDTQIMLDKLSSEEKEAVENALELDNDFDGQPSDFLPAEEEQYEINMHDPDEFDLDKGTVLVRYRHVGPSEDTGRFFSVPGVEFDKLGLPGKKEDYIETYYEILRPITMQGGVTASAFGRPGGAPQYTLKGHSVDKLLDNKMLQELRFAKYTPKEKDNPLGKSSGQGQFDESRYQSTAKTDSFHNTPDSERSEEKTDTKESLDVPSSDEIAAKQKIREDDSKTDQEKLSDEEQNEPMGESGRLDAGFADEITDNEADVQESRDVLTADETIGEKETREANSGAEQEMPSDEEQNESTGEPSRLDAVFSDGITDDEADVQESRDVLTADETIGEKETRKANSGAEQEKSSDEEQNEPTGESGRQDAVSADETMDEEADVNSSTDEPFLDKFSIEERVIENASDKTIVQSHEVPQEDTSIQDVADTDDTEDTKERLYEKNPDTQIEDVQVTDSELPSFETYVDSDPDIEEIRTSPPATVQQGNGIEDITLQNTIDDIKSLDEGAADTQYSIGKIDEEPEQQAQSPEKMIVQNNESGDDGFESLRLEGAVDTFPGDADIASIDISSDSPESHSGIK